jgi:hypothetical protein
MRLCSVEGSCTSVATLRDLIVRVRERSAEEKVTWVHARRVVARVADVHALGNATVLQFPCYTVCSALLTVVRDTTIALRPHAVAFERPARVGRGPRGHSFESLSQRAVVASHLSNLPNHVEVSVRPTIVGWEVRSLSQPFCGRRDARVRCVTALRSRRSRPTALRSTGSHSSGRLDSPNL